MVRLMGGRYRSGCEEMIYVFGGEWGRGTCRARMILVKGRGGCCGMVGGERGEGRGVGECLSDFCKRGWM